MGLHNPFIPIAGSGIRYSTPTTLAADETLVPHLSDTFDLGSPTNLYRKGYLSELDAVLFAKNTITLLGGWFYITKDAGTLAAAVLVADTTIDFGKAMTPNDFVVLRSALKVEYVQVGTLVSGTLYNVTRNVDGSGADAWPMGAPFAVFGNTGNGRIELNAYDTPRISITEQGATYNAQTERMRLGDLALWQGAGLTGYGWAVGDYAGGKYAYYSPVAGLVVRGTINADAGYLGALSISGVLSIGASGGVYQGTGTFASPNTGLKIYNSGGVGLLETWGSNGAGGWVKQAYMDTTGTIAAGAGAVLLNKDGLTVKRGATSHDLTPLPNRLKFIDAVTGDISTEIAGYLGADDVSGTNVLSIRANLTHRSPSGNEAGRILLTALSASALYPSAVITVGSDLGNGSAGDCYVSMTGAKLALSNAVAIGTTPALTGAIRLANGGIINARKADNSADVNLLYLNSLNRAVIGTALDMSAQEIINVVDLQLGTNPAASGVVRLPNDSWIAGRNAANGADVNIIKVDNQNRPALNGPVSFVPGAIRGITGSVSTTLGVGATLAVPVTVGLLVVTNDTDNGAGIYALGGGGQTLISSSGGAWGVGTGLAGDNKLYVYWDGVAVNYKIINRYTVSRAVSFISAD